MKKITILLSAVAAMLFTWSCRDEEIATTGNIYGIISDAETNAPIAGAQVILSPGNITTVTGSDGNYEFQHIEEGQYKLAVSASGYNTNSRLISVIGGERLILDMQMLPEEEVFGIEVSTSRLDFETSHDALTFKIKNVSTSGSIDWYISDVENWLTVSPMEGTTAMGMTSSVKVTVDRSRLTSDETTIFTVNAAGGSASIMVIVDVEDQNGNYPGNDDDNDDPNNNPGGGNEDDEPSVNEDYSSATVRSGDDRIKAEIVSCRRNGTTVTFEYTLVNAGCGELSYFNINPCQGLNSPLTVITDENYNQYKDYTYSFNGKREEGTAGHSLSASFPEYVKVPGSFTVKDFNPDSKYLTVRMGIGAALIEVPFTENRIYFENVPIY
ncbi:MAG TPA: carboxypeptidase-like regulatory domain-containing protein [Candidatus Coprenecus stercoravium]|uniref:Carboxypeptidase-like regulatory domain-containing protein n=1 Tax=Candidatus Coprenecus stercoravium TaxID=2840735 RepID=A0A9D2GQ75_9BACT|nr:carboxypeptidase-like regulatory domain-containing protein [Candidatus Coprenecus stercoravium]